MNINIEKNEEALRTLGQDLKTKLNQYKADRKTLEQQLLKNLRQYRSKYDPEIEAVLNSLEYKNRSKVYPRDTHLKVTGFVAKMMEMMFPAAEKNWSLKPTPYPNIAESDLNLLIAGLAEQKIQAFQQAQAQGQPMAQPADITSKEIEEAVQAFARDRAAKMEKEIEDQLADIGGERIEYPQLVKKVLRSAGIYGFGVLEGPLVRTQQERVWQPGANGVYTAKDVKKLRPFLGKVSVWDLFPDLSAKSWWEQQGIFRRRVFLKNGLLEMLERADFKGRAEVAKKYIKEHPDGNYVALDYEAELDAVNNTSNLDKTKKGRFEVYRYLGYFPGETLAKVGVSLTEEQKLKDVLADVWLLDNEIIKADLAPFGNSPADSYFVFIYEDDEESGLTGVGLPEVLRDSQMRLCSIDRATMDNMASVAGPIWEINKALLGRGYDGGAMHSFKVIYRDDDNPATAGTAAVRQIATNSYIGEYLSLRQEVKQILDFESSLPGMLFGQTEGLGEAFRTSNNMSMLTGAANMVTKDVVRSFDRFTASVIGALVAWNMEFNDKQEIKGDYQVQPEGSLSLVAKEVRGAALDQLWMSMSPEEKAIVKVHKILTERFRSRDLPADYLEDEDTARQILDNMAKASAAARQKEEALTEAKTQKTAAEAQEILQTLGSKIEDAQASVAQKLASAKGVKDRGQLESIKLLLDQLQSATRGGTGKPAASSSTQPGGTAG